VPALSESMGSPRRCSRKLAGSSCEFRPGKCFGEAIVRGEKAVRFHGREVLERVEAGRSEDKDGAVEESGQFFDGPADEPPLDDSAMVRDEREGGVARANHIEAALQADARRGRYAGRSTRDISN
jgi:hypothetical protein